MKHIFDRFVRSPSRGLYFAELAADLFAGYDVARCYNPQRELEQVEENRQAFLQKQNKLDESLIIGSFPLELPGEIVRLGISSQVLSHIVSLTSYSQLTQRMEELELYLRQNRRE